MRSKIFSFSIMFIMVMFLFFPVKADSRNVEENITEGQKVILNNPELSEYSTLSEPNQLRVGNYDISLYVEFDNWKQAIENFELKHSDTLKNLELKYNLDKFSEDNGLLYYEYFLEDLDTESGGNISDEELSSFRKFFDIYETRYLNRDIIQIVNKINSNRNERIYSNKLRESDSEEKNDFFALSLIVPMYNDLAEETNNLIKESITPIEHMESKMSSRGLTGNSKSNAISYASKYASSRNPNYENFRADCTNFASQILEAAGVPQSVYSSEHSGWWHKKIRKSSNFPPGYYYSHSHSVSWINAGTFARYMGIGKRAYNIKQLGDMVVPGDFIVGDWTGNGSWNHVAFVTDTDSYYGNYTSKNGKNYYYKDFKVAQHTSDYHLWVSNKSNNWEDFEPSQVVALVRR